MRSGYYLAVNHNCGMRKLFAVRVPSLQYLSLNIRVITCDPSIFFPVNYLINPCKFSWKNCDILSY